MYKNVELLYFRSISVNCEIRQTFKTLIPIPTQIHARHRLDAGHQETPTAAVEIS